MFKKIVGFGDSWMWGDELLDPTLVDHPQAHPVLHLNDGYRLHHCFLGQLGEHYSVPTENFGIPGGSLQSTIWTYLWWMQNETLPLQDCLVLICLTEADRMSFYNPNHVHYSNDPPWNKFVHSTWVEYGSSVVPEDFRVMIKQQTVLTNCRALRELTYLQSALFFDGQAARHSIKTLQFHLLPPPIQHPMSTVIWPDFCWTLYFRDHPGNQRRELIKPGGHPNEAGHKMMAQMLIPEIDRVILAGC